MYLLSILDAENTKAWREKVEKYESESNIIILVSSSSDSRDHCGAHSLGVYTQSLIGSQFKGVDFKKIIL